MQGVTFIVALPGEKLFDRYLIAATDLLAGDFPCADGVYDRSLAADGPSLDVFGKQFDHLRREAADITRRLRRNKYARTRMSAQDRRVDGRP